MERMTELLTGVFSETGVEIAADLTPDDIYTNEFLDPSITLD
tara:strand:- start:730 stop:855 length:126 start_codon:yes stop_codon:yes gene_type:complete